MMVVCKVLKMIEDVDVVVEILSDFNFMVFWFF